MADSKVWKTPVSRGQDHGMACRRCKSRHAAHLHTSDTDDDLLPGRWHGRGREKARVIREGVARWTFPARTPTRPPPASSRSWQAPHPWSVQFQHVPDYNIPDMEGVVSEELRHRIERVLSVPTGATAGEETTTDTTPTNGQEDRCPAGGLLQDYLDHLEPEGADDDELFFQGSEREESDADLLYDSEKETYTTPYLLFLQQARSRKTDLPALQRKLLEDDPPEDEEKENKATEEGREGAMGRSGYRSSVPTTSRTFINSKELPTSASNSKEPPTPASTSKEHPTPASTSKEPPTPASDDADQEHTKVYFRRASQNKNDDSSKIGIGDHKEFEKHTGISGDIDEDFMPENDEDEVAHDQSQKKKKKKKKRKKGSQGEVTDEETEEETHKANLEELKKSITLELFRDFAKNVFAKDHPEFRLFESFEELDKSKESDVLKVAHES